MEVGPEAAPTLFEEASPDRVPREASLRGAAISPGPRPGSPSFRPAVRRGGYGRPRHPPRAARGGGRPSRHDDDARRPPPGWRYARSRAAARPRPGRPATPPRGRRGPRSGSTGVGARPTAIGSGPSPQCRSVSRRARHGGMPFSAFRQLAPMKSLKAKKGSLGLAETEGFEPSVGVIPLRRFSKPLVSATHPRLQARRSRAYIGRDPIVQPSWPCFATPGGGPRIFRKAAAGVLRQSGSLAHESGAGEAFRRDIDSTRRPFIAAKAL